jgi:hypothetical protein
MSMPDADEPRAWLLGEIKTPPLSSVGRVEARFPWRRRQRGERLPGRSVNPIDGARLRMTPPSARGRITKKNLEVRARVDEGLDWFPGVSRDQAGSVQTRSTSV